MIVWREKSVRADFARRQVHKRKEKTSKVAPRQIAKGTQTKIAKGTQTKIAKYRLMVDKKKRNRKQTPLQSRSCRSIFPLLARD
jgi:hypothetical protein